MKQEIDEGEDSYNKGTFKHALDVKNIAKSVLSLLCFGITGTSGNDIRKYISRKILNHRGPDNELKRIGAEVEFVIGREPVNYFRKRYAPPWIIREGG